MKLLLPFCALIPLACTAEEKPLPPPKSFVTRMSLDNGKDSTLDVDTGKWTGRISIAPDVKIDYQNVRTSSTAGSDSKATLLLDGVLMTIERNGLLFGTDSRVKLGDKVAVEVRKDGVYVAGDKALALPVK